MLGANPAAGGKAAEGVGEGQRADYETHRREERRETFGSPDDLGTRANHTEAGRKVTPVVQDSEGAHSEIGRAHV